MNSVSFSLAGAQLQALGSGALWWPDQGILVVSDLHLGKSARPARRGGALLPPYETRETLARLGAEIAATGAGRVICLGDSFDHAADAGEICAEDRAALVAMMQGRHWHWIEGNHDAGASGLGAGLAELRLGPLTFRHIAQPGARAEVSGHYHPKARIGTRGRHVTRPCFVTDAARLILPAFGAYTGGLSCADPAIAGLMGDGARVILTGATPRALPMPRA